MTTKKATRASAKGRGAESVRACVPGRLDAIRDHLLGPYWLTRVETVLSSSFDHAPFTVGCFARLLDFFLSMLGGETASSSSSWGRQDGAAGGQAAMTAR